MSVPSPELVKMLQAKQAQSGNDASAAPGGTPMATPQIPAGQREAAMSVVGTCLDQLEMVLGKLGTETEEGQAIMKALQALGKVFGQHRSRMQELAPAQILQMIQKLPSPMQGAAQPPMPGGPPPGMGGPPPQGAM